MAELPSVIPSALIHVINTLESDDTHQYHWKISRNSENVSLFVKCILPAKSVVPGSFPVKPAGNKSRKKKTPSALGRSANRLKRFQEKKAAEQAALPKSPAKEVVSAVRKEQETITVLPRTVVTIWNHQIGLLIKGHLVKSRGRSIWITRLQNTCINNM